MLKDGALTLSDGSGELFSGIKTLKDGSGDLIDGVSQLKDGSKELDDGMKKFRDEGVKKIVDAYNGDISEFIDRLKAVAEAAEDYTSYSGVSDSMKGSVKFIYTTDGVEKPDDSSSADKKAD